MGRLTIDGMPLTGCVSRRAFAGGLPIAALANLPARAQAGGDSSLLELGRQWQALAEQRDACFAAQEGLATTDPRFDALDRREERLYEEQAVLEEAIFAAPASSIAALAVKARLLARLNDCERLDSAGLETALESRTYFEERCALSLALDIVRLAEREKAS